MDGSRFIEMLDADMPTLEELEMTGCLHDPYRHLRAQIAAAQQKPLSKAMSAPCTSPLADLARSPTPAKSPSWPFSKLVRRISGRSGAGASPPGPNARKLRSARRPLSIQVHNLPVSTARPTSPLALYASPEEMRPSARRSTSAPLEVPLAAATATPPSPRRWFQLAIKPKKQDTASSGTETLSDEEGIDILGWQTDIKRSFDVLSRPSYKPVDRPPRTPEAAPCIAVTRRARVFSTPTPQRPRLSDVFPCAPSSPDSPPASPSSTRPFARRHSCTPELVFSKRPLGTPSDESSVQTPSPHKSLLTSSRPPSPIARPAALLRQGTAKALLPLAASRSCSTDSATSAFEGTFGTSVAGDSASEVWTDVDLPGAGAAPVRIVDLYP